MTTQHLTTLVLIAVCAASPLAASGFEVVAATGALEPEGLKAGQELEENTRLRLEPWGRVLIREKTKCGLTHVIAGLGDYVLALSEDCSAIEEPVNVAARVQRGEVFAARVEETGSSPADELVKALSGEPCVFLARVSEEADNRRRCPSGYALRGLRCTGPHCDDKDLMCCPYLDGAPDPSTKLVNSRWISEEWPNVMQSKQFLNGLECRGPYCDDVLPQTFKSKRLVNAKKCDWSAWDSEQPATWLDCAPGRFAAGIRCRADFCADVGLHCCEAQVE